MKNSLIAIVTVLLVGAGMAKRAVSAKNGRAQTPAAPQTEQRESGRARSPSASNLSKLRRDELVGKIGEIKSFLEKSSDTNAVRLLRFAAEVEREVREKKFGLVFEEHREKIDLMLEENLPVLTEVKKRYLAAKSAKAETPLNFLIEGDNLAALKLLKKTHRGEIDLIYIDPPYNTGNKDFIYNDSYVDKTDTFHHSKWLSFMKKRLLIAKELLKKDGVILISIDNNEGFHLKLLLDEIFGETSFAADLHVETSAIAGPRRFAAVKGSVVKTAEFVLGYVNGSNTQIMRHPMYDYIPGFDTHYSLYYNSKSNKFVKFVDVLKHTKITQEAFERLNLPISVKNLSKLVLVDDDVRSWLYSDEIAGNLFREGDSSSLTIDDIKDCLKRGELVCYEGSYYRIGDSGNLIVIFRYKDRLGACDDYFESFGERSIRGNLWKGFSSDGGNLAKEGYVSFKNGKKPKRLLRQLIRAISSDEQKNSMIVLDFFAGSGTTGHAVMELNATDGGHRSFILVNNNDEGICEKVTYERLKRVIERDKYAASLKYFKVDYIPIGGKVYYDYADELLKHIRELVELENAIDFRNDSTIAIAVTDKEFEKFVANDKNMEGKRALYVGHDVLIGKSARQKLERMGIEIRIIPQYYYSEQEA